MPGQDLPSPCGFTAIVHAINIAVEGQRSLLRLVMAGLALLSLAATGGAGAQLFRPAAVF